MKRHRPLLQRTKMHSPQSEFAPCSRRLASGIRQPALKRWINLDRAVQPVLVLEQKIEPRVGRDPAQLISALAQLASEDSTFGYFRDAASGETVVASIGEDQLEAQLETLQRTYGVEFLLGPPRVRYRETVKRPVQMDYTHKRIVGGAGEFARVVLAMAPNERGAGNLFENLIFGGVIPESFIPVIEECVRLSWLDGLLGYPLIDSKVALCNGAFHELDSSPAAFQIATRNAIKEGLKRAGIKLLEPIMDVEVVTPGEFVGSVIGDIGARRAQIRAQEMRGNATVLHADVPMERMLGYAHSLRSLTQNRGSCEMRFSHYDEVRSRWDPDDFPPAVGMRA